MKVTNTSSRIMDVLNAQDCQKKSFERQLEKLLGWAGASAIWKNHSKNKEPDTKKNKSLTKWWMEFWSEVLFKFPEFQPV